VADATAEAAGVTVADAAEIAVVAAAAAADAGNLELEERRMSARGRN
jgi:hypothetical protein